MADKKKSAKKASKKAAKPAKDKKILQMAQEAEAAPQGILASAWAMLKRVGRAGTKTTLGITDAAFESLAFPARFMMGDLD